MNPKNSFKLVDFFIYFWEKTKNMPSFDALKELLQGRNTAIINTFINKNPGVLDEIDQNGISGLMYIGYHQLPEVLAVAVDIKKEFTIYEAAAMGLLHRVITKVNSQPALLNTPAKDGFLPLTLACFFGQYPVVKYLLKKGAKVNIPANNPSKVMPLHSAVAKNDYAICELLLKNGADVNATQMKGVTALQSAAHQGNLELVQLLVANGAEIDMETTEGKTALSFAEEDGHETVADFLKNAFPLPGFGMITLNNLEAEYEAGVLINDKAISLDLNFEATTIPRENLSLVKKILNNLPDYQRQTRAAIVEDAKDEDGITREYLEFHIEELLENELQELLGHISSQRKRRKKVFKLLQLNRIGFYPEAEQNHAVFDYTIGDELTDYLLVVVMNQNDKIEFITMES